MGSFNFTPKPPLSGLIGHRGVAALAPENTLASFELASKQGIEWVEFDVRLTRDEHLIIFHDDTLERTTNGSGLVNEHTLDHLIQLDAGSWFAPRFKGQTIPVFSKMITTLNQLQLFSNIELKVPPNASKHHCDTLVDLLIDNLKHYWPKDNPWPLVSSFQWELLIRLRAKMPDIPIGFLQENCSYDMIEIVTSTPNSALHCGYESLTEPCFRTAKTLPSLSLLIPSINLILRDFFSMLVFMVCSATILIICLQVRQ